MEAAAELNVTGSVYPDIAREIPVISLASGRVVDIQARLDDNVKKGQLLLTVQSPDITNAFDVYLKASNDELLANKAYIRAQDLYNHGAIPLGSLEQAEDTENDAKADLTAAEGQLDTLGVDKDHPSNIVNVYAPISGVIVAQDVTNAAAAGVTYTGSPTAFTVADLSVVWIICDVYENDIPKIHLGQEARIHVTAYPDRLLTGQITDIGPVLDPNIRTAKVRIEIRNPGILKLGMFVTATFESTNKQAFAVVPASAILHLHDRDWVYVPAGGQQFKLVEVNAGEMLPGNQTADSFRYFARPAGGSERSLIRRNAGGAMIRRLVDFALQNRFLVLAVAMLLFAWGLFRSTSFLSKRIRTWRTTTSISSRSGPESPPNRSSSRSRSRSKS